MFLTARNILKAWLLLGGFVAAFTALGWWIGGLGLASVFFVVCLLMAATVFWYGPRIVLASLGARELTLAEATLLHTTVERLAARAGVGRPRVYLLPSGHPACDLGRAWRVELGRRPEQGAHRGASTRGARGRDRTRAREDPAARRRRPDPGGGPCGLARRGEPHRRLAPARAPLRPRARSRRASSRSCSRRGGSSPPTCAPRTSASRRTALPTRSSGSSR